MGNKRSRVKKPEGRSKNRRIEYLKIARLAKSAKRKSVNSPRSLRVLCDRVVKKYKLLPEPKKFTPPESFSVVGGKPLRKRSEPKLPEEKKKVKTEKRYNPKSLLTLCESVVEEYNLLPQTEEILYPSSYHQTLLDLKKNRLEKGPVSKEGKKKKRGRPKKKPAEETQFALHCEIKRPRGRPHKDSSADSYTVTYTYPQESNIRIKEELDLPSDSDPLQQDEENEFTIEIKEEVIEEDNEDPADSRTVHVPLVTSQGILINPLAHAQIPGPSQFVTASRATPNFMTVVVDEYQIFANSIAEQLRVLPPNRALLLQLDIQSMLDNERQLMRHEN